MWILLKQTYHEVHQYHKSIFNLVFTIVITSIVNGKNEMYSMWKHRHQQCRYGECVSIEM